MSQIYKPGSGGGGGGIIQTINGDVGSITGATVTIYANNTANNSGSSVEFVNSGTVSTLNLTDTNLNTFLGTDAGNSTVSTSGLENVGIGALSMTNASTEQNNVAIGYASLSGVTGGANYNIAIGYGAGQGYTGGETANILLANNGNTGESNTLRIGGNTGTGSFGLDAAYVQGISGNTQPVAGSIQFVTIDASGGPSNGLLGVTTTTAPTMLWTDESTSFTAVGNNGYFTTATLIATLPSAPSQGQIVRIVVTGSAITTIQASGTQIINIGNSSSTTGGTATNTFQGDTIELVYRTVTNTWWSTSSTGSWILA